MGKIVKIAKNSTMSRMATVDRTAFQAKMIEKAWMAKMARLSRMNKVAKMLQRPQTWKWPKWTKRAVWKKDRLAEMAK